MNTETCPMEVEDAQKRLEDALLEDEQGNVRQCYNEVLEAQEKKIKLLLEENLQQKEMLKQAKIRENIQVFSSLSSLSHEMPGFAQNQQQMCASHQTSNDPFNHFRQSAIPPRPLSVPVPQVVQTNQTSEFPPTTQTQTTLFNNQFNQMRQPPPIPPRTFNQQQSSTVFTSRQELSNLNYHQPSVQIFSANNPFQQIQQPIPPRNSNHPSEVDNQQQSCTAIQGFSNSNIHSPDTIFAQSPMRQQSLNPFNKESSDVFARHGNNQQQTSNSNKSYGNPFLPQPRQERSDIAISKNNNAKNEDFIVPYKTWLKKHNMKEKQSFRGRRGGAVEKREYFRKKYGKENPANATLNNVASFHLALAKGAANNEMKGKRKWKK